MGCQKNVKTKSSFKHNENPMQTTKAMTFPFQSYSTTKHLSNESLMEEVKPLKMAIYEPGII